MQYVKTVLMSVGLKMDEIKTKYLSVNIRKLEKMANVGEKSLEWGKDY